MGDVDDKGLKEEMETCKQLLVVSEIENGKHRVYKLASDTLDPKYLLEELDDVCDSLKRAAKLNS